MKHRHTLALASALWLVWALPAIAAKKSPGKAAAPSAAPAPEMARVIRETRLLQQPFADAEPVAVLPDQTTVQILGRQGAWMQVQVGEATGWLRLLSLRTAAAPATGGDSGLSAAINVARRGSSGNTVATGVRGLSKEQISNATPNAAELARMQSHAANEASARAFAAAAPAATVDVPFLAAGDR